MPLCPHGVGEEGRKNMTDRVVSKETLLDWLDTAEGEYDYATEERCRAAIHDLIEKYGPGPVKPSAGKTAVSDDEAGGSTPPPGSSSAPKVISEVGWKFVTLDPPMEVKEGGDTVFFPFGRFLFAANRDQAAIYEWGPGNAKGRKICDTNPAPAPLPAEAPQAVLPKAVEEAMTTLSVEVVRLAAYRKNNKGEFTGEMVERYLAAANAALSVLRAALGKRGIERITAGEVRR